LVRGLQPKVFLAENVSGLVKGTARGYFLEILAALKACGYRVQSRLLDAQWLGVPQMRQRIIFVGVRNDLGLEPRFPKPLPYRYSLRDALPWVTRAVHDTSGAFSSGEFTDAPSPAITVGVGSLNSCHYQITGPDPETDITRYAIGREWDRLAVGQKSEKYLNLIKVDPDRPCNTVTATGNVGTAAVTHPYEKRKFTIAELKRICGFPDDFILTGSYAQQWERLGRAVPPIMMRHIAEAVLPILEESRC